jgi:hypothetical protein
MAEHDGLLLLGQGELEAARLWARFPPRVANLAKRQLLDLAGGVARVPRGRLRVARYACGRLPATCHDLAPTLHSVEGGFAYEAEAAGDCAWYVNFADQHLFFAYGSPAFAQDEIQVAEHPILGSLREALLAEQLAGIPPLTTERERPTPILVRGAERWCAIDLDPDLAMPYGIYGRRLQQASQGALEQAVQRLDTGQCSNLIAMAAPQGQGRYTAAQIAFVLETAWVGFRAARLESDADCRVVVHSGHWGTGAFGGDKVLMAALQILAAHLARVDTLVYHSLGPDGVAAFDEGRRVAARLLEASKLTSELVQGATELGFAWGTSDGN